MSDTKATSFCSDTMSLSRGGTTRRMACGSTTCRMVCALDKPSDRAAARWLSCTLSMPARNTSATYPEYVIPSATEPHNNGELNGRSSPKPGTPKPTR